MAEQRDARELIAKEMCDHAYHWGERPHNWDHSKTRVRETFLEGADAILAALAAEGWAVVRIEPAAWMNPDGIGQTMPRERLEACVGVAQGELLYRVVSPSTREAEK